MPFEPDKINRNTQATASLAERLEDPIPQVPQPIHHFLTLQCRDPSLVPVARMTRKWIKDQEGFTEDGTAVPCLYYQTQTKTQEMMNECRRTVGQWAEKNCSGPHFTVYGYWWFFAQESDALAFWEQWKNQV